MKKFVGVHPKDLERVKKDEFWVERFLMHEKNNVEKALQLMWKSVEWRKANNINGI